MTQNFRIPPPGGDRSSNTLTNVLANSMGILGRKINQRRNFISLKPVRLKVAHQGDRAVKVASIARTGTTGKADECLSWKSVDIGVYNRPLMRDAVAL